MFAGSNDVLGLDAGTCGDNVSWKMDDDGNMTIYGTGQMKDYTGGECPSYCGAVNAKAATCIQNVYTIQAIRYAPYVVWLQNMDAQLIN